MGDLVWVSLTISELCDPADEQILAWEGEKVLGYVKSYSVDEDTIDSEQPDIWAFIHVLDNRNVPYQYDFYYNFIKDDDDSIQRPLTEFEVSWHTHNAEF